MGETAPPAREKKSCRLAGSQGSPRERQTEKGAPQPPQRGRFLGFRWTHICDRWGPSGLGVSPVPGAARAAGVMAGARGAAHDTGGAGQVPPLMGLQQTVVTTAWGGGWRAERRLLTTLVQGAGGKTQPDLLKRQEAGRREVGQTVMEAAVGGPELGVGSQRSPCRVAVSLQGGWGVTTLAPGTWAPGGPALGIRTLPVLFLSGK